SLVIKDKSSSNIIDAVTGYEGRKFSKKGFLDLTNMICDAFSNQINEFTDGTYPVVFSSDDVTYLKKFYETLHGMMFGSGSSLLSGKIGRQVFSPDFTLYQTRRAEDGFPGAFFDSEGTVNPDDRFALIEDGVLIAPYTDKKTSSTFKLPLTGAAGGEYDGLPELRLPLLKIKESEKTAKQLLNDRMGIFVLIASGGDFTPDGHFASPVQLAFLFDGERFVGRLPELSINSSLQEMFGRNFVGVSKNDFFGLENTKVAVMNMSVERLRK
ncbi:MAG: peptidase U62, partial [Mesotoga sp.]|nr:peptidase U62 [Mesotoga sp.]